MKKFLFLIVLVLFYGCAEKAVTISMVAKPNVKEIRDINVTQNNRLNLNKKVIENMEFVNQIVPNYFKINKANNYNVLKTDIKNFNLNITNYQKRVPIEYFKKKECEVYLYQCKNINNMVFCSNNYLKYNLNEYKKLKEYKYKNYVLVNNKLYKKVIKCPKKYQKLSCQKANANLTVNFKVLNNSDAVFNKIYQANYLDDSCKDIDTYYMGDDTKYYVEPKESIINYITDKVSEKFVNDIAPHTVKFDATFINELDVKLSKKDEKLYESIIDKFLNEDGNKKSLINQYLGLVNKYKNSCVLKYNLGIMLEKVEEYQKAKNIFENIQKCPIKGINLHLKYLNNLYNI
jgi:hypothetical protein